MINVCVCLISVKCICIFINCIIIVVSPQDGFILYNIIMIVFSGKYYIK